MGLAAFGTFCFIAFGLLGLKTSTRKYFTHVDLIYYPLGAIGVAFLYFQQASDRALIEATDNHSKARQELIKFEESKPDISKLNSHKTFAESSGGLFQTIGGMNDACDHPTLTDATCRVARSIGPITNKYEIYFQFDDALGLNSLCETAPKLFDELENEDAMSSFVLGLTKDKYSSGLSSGFWEFDYDRVVEFLSEFERQSANDIDTILKLAFNDKNDAAIVREKYTAEASFAYTILRSYGVCFRAPEYLRSGELSEWITKHQEEKVKIDDLKSVYMSAIEDAALITPMYRIKSYIWPYILILALALKFGKATSGLRK